MEKYAVIVAGGSGTRLGGDIPKQFRDLCGRPVLWRAIEAFHSEDPECHIVVVMNSGYETMWHEFVATIPDDERIPHAICHGGGSRTESVMNGLALVPDSGNALVAVHDGARPLVTPAIVARGWETALEYGAAIPAIPVTDTLRRLTDDGSVAVERKDYVAVQTPQVFRADILHKAYRRAAEGTYTDDASVAEAAGIRPVLFPGSPDNMKVTNPGDLEIASLLYRQQNGKLP